MSKEETESGNPFFLEELYPDATGLFEIELPPIEEIKQDCLVVLDTNALLFPYQTSKDSLEAIKETYRGLIQESRLFVPAHVAREFVENRPEQLANLLKSLNDHKGRYNEKAKPERIVNTPMLQALTEFRALTEVETEVDATLSELRRKHADALDKLTKKVRDWRWNDPVSAVYKELFSESVIIEPQIDRDAFLEDAKRRKRYKIPPGYKDVKESRADGRNLYGDLKIWHTILELGQQGKSLIFVSRDEKADWHHQSNGSSLYARFELVEEYKRASNGQAFYNIRLSRLLNLYGASSEVVAEIARDETPIGRTTLADIEYAIASWWFDYTYDGRSNRRSDEFDLDLHYRSEEFSHNTSSFIAQIIVVDDIYSFDIPEVRLKARKLSKAVQDSGYDGGKLFVVFENEYTAEHGKNVLSPDLADNVQLYVCFYQDGSLGFV